MRLYDITADMAVLLDEVDDAEGEVSPDLEERLDAVQARLEDKVDACCAVMRGLELEAAALREEEQRLAARRRAVEAKRERLRDYVTDCLDRAGVSKVRGARFSAALTRSKGRVHVRDESLLPEAYRVHSWRPDKRAIAAAIEAGEDVPGAVVDSGRLALTVR